MCIDGKTESLAEKLKQHVLDKLDSAEEAREMITENIRDRQSQIASMAELFYENREQFGIVRQVAQVRTHRGTKLSALRGAIVLVLQEYIDEEQAKLDEALPQFGEPQVALV